MTCSVGWQVLAFPASWPSQGAARTKSCDILAMFCAQGPPALVLGVVSPPFATLRSGRQDQLSSDLQGLGLRTWRDCCPQDRYGMNGNMQCWQAVLHSTLRVVLQWGWLKGVAFLVEAKSTMSQCERNLGGQAAGALVALVLQSCGVALHKRPVKCALRPYIAPGSSCACSLVPCRCTIVRAGRFKDARSSSCLLKLSIHCLHGPQAYEGDVR